MEGLPRDSHRKHRSTLRGSLLHLTCPEERLAEDNRFVGLPGASPEIWPYGFRNPWRFSFDRETGLWLGGLGSSQQEEINLIQIGRNYGWNIMEGTICYEPNGCDVDSLETPLVELDEEGPQYCAIIGEYAFQGRGIPPLVGPYVYADFCTGAIYAVWYDGYSDPYHQFLIDTELNISSFGQDLAGNLYILSGRPRGDQMDSLHRMYHLTLRARE